MEKANICICYICVYIYIHIYLLYMSMYLNTYIFLPCGDHNFVLLFTSRIYQLLLLWPTSLCNSSQKLLLMKSHNRTKIISFCLLACLYLSGFSMTNMTFSIAPALSSTHLAVNFLNWNYLDKHLLCVFYIFFCVDRWNSHPQFEL